RADARRTGPRGDGGSRPPHPRPLGPGRLSVRYPPRDAPRLGSLAQVASLNRLPDLPGVNAPGSLVEECYGGKAHQRNELCTRSCGQLAKQGPQKDTTDGPAVQNRTPRRPAFET